MRSLLARVVVVVVVGLMLFVLARDVRARRDASRFGGLAWRAFVECRSYRAQPGHRVSSVCAEDRFLDPLGVRMEGPYGKLDRARAALADHVPEEARAALIAALVEAETIERTSGLLGSARRAEVVDRALDLLSSSVEGLDDPALRAALRAHASSEEALRPFERERIDMLWATSRYASIRLDGSPTLSPGELADEMERDGRLFEAMGAATLAHDEAACVRHAEQLGMLARPVVQKVHCRALANVLRVQARVDRELGSPARR